MSSKLPIVLSALLILSGCVVGRNSFRASNNSKFKPSGLRAIVRANCLTAPVVLEDCHFSDGQPKCRAAKVTYRLDCAEIQVSKDTTPAK
jgi:hypothetical protein